MFNRVSKNSVAMLRNDLLQEIIDFNIKYKVYKIPKQSYPCRCDLSKLDCLRQGLEIIIKLTVLMDYPIMIPYYDIRDANLDIVQSILNINPIWFSVASQTEEAKKYRKYYVECVDLALSLTYKKEIEKQYDISTVEIEHLNKSIQYVATSDNLDIQRGIDLLNVSFIKQQIQEPYREPIAQILPSHLNQTKLMTQTIQIAFDNLFKNDTNKQTKHNMVRLLNEINRLPDKKISIKVSIE